MVRGAQKGFTETLRLNTALLRRRLMTPDLVMEAGMLGRRTRDDICLCYLDGVVHPDLVQEVRRRLSSVDVDMISDTGVLEQFIEDHPKSLLPTLGSTQRPDRAAAQIAEGRVVILVEGSPYALIGPVTFGDFFRNPEDYSIKWPFGTFLRLVRMLGMFVTLLLPSLYISFANVHQEMLPTALVLAIAASREPVPFPAPVEVLIMEVSFEIIREGSLRIPAAMGQTAGIVGALILGQAAVQASIISPILVIIVATTALGSFTIPDYGMSLAVPVVRFGFILLGSTFGLYGIAIGLLLLAAHTSGLKSLGVPYMAPIGPRLRTSPDLIVRGQLYTMDQRPEMLRP